MKSYLSKYLFVVILILLIQSSQLFSQEIWDLVWQKNTASVITAVNLSPDGKIAVAGDGEGLIKAWDCETGSLMWDQVVSGQVDELIFSPDGTKLISRGSSLNLLNPNTGGIVWNPFFSVSVWSVKFNSDGKKLVVGTTEEIRILDLESHNTIGTAETGWIFEVDFSSDDSMVVSAGVDKELILWNANTLHKIWTGEYNNDLRTVDFSPDDKKVVACDYTGLIAAWDVATGTRDWIKNTFGGAFNLFYTPDGSKIIAGGQGVSDVQVLNSSNGSLLWTGIHSTIIHSLDLSADGERLLSASLDDSLKVWDLNTGNLLWYENFKSKIARISVVGDKIIAGGAATGGSGTIKLWHYEKSLQLTSSVANNEIKAGTTFEITWNSKNITNIKLEYTTNNGNTWTVIAENISASLGNYAWTVPAVKSTQCKIRINEAGNANTKDETLLPFTIYIPSITLTNPANGNTLKGGTTQTLTWTSERVSTVEIYYSINNGSTWNLISQNIPATNGSYNWLVPLLNSSYCKIAVVDSSDALVRGENNGTFTIYKDLEITSPTAASLLEIGSLQNITWVSSTTDKIGIEYSTNSGGTWTTIISSISANVGYYVWTIPNTPSQNCRIRIFNPDNTNEYDESEGLFTIFNRELKLTGPNGGETLIAGHIFKVKWDNKYVNQIKLEYSLNGGNNWNMLANDIAASLDSITLEVPDVSSDSCKIKITDIDKNELFDESDSVFSIYRSSIAVTNPKGGESWISGTTQEITWTGSYVSNIKIEYTIDNGISWNVIVNDLSAGIGKYFWIVTNATSSKCKIRISDINNTNVTAESDSVFSIYQPLIFVTNPKGGEIWISGTQQEIRWSIAFVSKVKIEYTIDNGTSWKIIADNISADAGSYLWIVPNAESSSCKIRITDISNSNIIDESNSVFSIHQPLIVVTNPKGGETWVGGTQQEITWTNSFVSNVKIEYSLDNGTNWKIIIGSISAEAGKYLWIVPDTASSSCKIRITDIVYSQVMDENNEPFSIERATNIDTENDLFLPTKFALYQCYPNPFNPVTTINYSIPFTCFVSIKVFDVLGNEITTLVNEEKFRGNYKINFNAVNLTSGVYFYQIQAGDFSQTKKLILTK